MPQGLSVELSPGYQAWFLIGKGTEAMGTKKKEKVRRSGSGPCPDRTSCCSELGILIHCLKLSSVGSQTSPVMAGSPTTVP